MDPLALSLHSRGRRAGCIRPEAPVHSLAHAETCVGPSAEFHSITTRIAPSYGEAEPVLLGADLSQHPKPPFLLLESLVSQAGLCSLSRSSLSSVFPTSGLSEHTLQDPALRLSFPTLIWLLCLVRLSLIPTAPVLLLPVARDTLSPRPCTVARNGDVISSSRPQTSPPVHH